MLLQFPLLSTQRKVALSARLVTRRSSSYTSHIKMSEDTPEKSPTVRPSSLILPHKTSLSNAYPKYTHQLSEPAHERRKLSESRGVILPNITIVPEEGRLRAPDPNVPMTATSPVGTRIGLWVDTVIRRHVASTFMASPTPLSPHSQGKRPSSQMTSISNLGIRVHFSDMRFVKLSIDPTLGGGCATSQTLSTLVADSLQIPLPIATQAFSLWMVSPLMQVQLKWHHSALDVRKVWRPLLHKYIIAPMSMRHKHIEPISDDQPMLVYRRNVLMSKLRQRQLQTTENVLGLLYIEAREQLIDGSTPCTTCDAVKLAAIDMAIRCGPFDEETHTCSWLRDAIVEFVPSCHLPRLRCRRLFGHAVPKYVCGSANDVQLANEQTILAEYRNSSKLTVETLQENYLDICMAQPCYGSAQFRCYIERARNLGGNSTNENRSPGFISRMRGNSNNCPITIRLCVSREFITIYEFVDGSSVDTILFVRPLLDCQWFVSPAIGQDPSYRIEEPLHYSDLDLLPSLILHFADDTTHHKSNGHSTPHKSAGSCLIQIFSKQVPMINGLLHACVNVTQLEVERRITVEEENNPTNERAAGPPMEDVIAKCLDDDLPSNSELLASSKENAHHMGKAVLDCDGKCVESSNGSRLQSLMEWNAKHAEHADGEGEKEERRKSETVVVYRETTT